MATHQDRSIQLRARAASDAAVSRHVVQAEAGFQPGDVRAFRRLRDACNAAEGIDLPFFMVDEPNTASNRTHFFVRDHVGLAGFGHLPYDRPAEACLAVDPERRREGIGRAIVSAMRAELHRRGADGCFVVADLASPSARPFLDAESIAYRSSEFRLVRDRTDIAHPRPCIEGLELRVAGSSDAELLTSLLTEAFGDDPADARRLIDAGLKETNRHFYVALLDDAPIGLIRAGEIDGLGDVTAFGVLPHARGRGIGRGILNDIIDVLTAAGHDQIQIEVDADNPRALGLYRSCGFEIVAEYGFFWLDVA